jgi:glycosyltransferase involved in cell wall biosynthesis
MGKKSKKPEKKLPFVTICTPTFNRRPFIPMMLKCFDHQLYPKDRIEWLILDDGTDKIEELVTHVPQVKYFRFEEKLTLGQKRNYLNDRALGDIIIYMDDDDYYPPNRISHAVEMLRRSPKALAAGSSAMYLYFKHINKMYQFGPYGPGHATAATFAFKRELLNQTRFDENSSVAEEKKFLKEYTIPFVQLNPSSSIVVFSHNHNSFDKKELLNQLPNPYINEVDLKPSDLIKDQSMLKFFMEDIDQLLESYEPGKPENKPDVTKQILELKEQREKMIQDHIQQQQLQQHLQQQQQLMNATPAELHNQINTQSIYIQQILAENNELKEKVKYLENKITQFISEKINQFKINKHAESINTPVEPRDTPVEPRDEQTNNII